MSTLVDGVLARDRVAIGRAITLVESTHPDHRADAQELLQKLLPHTGDSQRVGISGVPGAGKSTFIDALGTRLTAGGHSVAVLAVDPTSVRSGGSILGDKTRMPRLATDPAAFIRPSPAAGTLGGVTRTTREAMLVVEAAGFDVVFVETVGVGQSETVVADMVDAFVVLMLPGAGDELQGIKRGVLELADMVVVTKADGDNEVRARQAVRDYKAALHLLTPAGAAWEPPVLACSSVDGTGLDAVWDQVEQHRSTSIESGAFAARRRDQQSRWMWTLVEERLLEDLRQDDGVRRMLPDLERQVRDGELTPALGADRLLQEFLE